MHPQVLNARFTTVRGLSLEISLLYNQFSTKNYVFTQSVVQFSRLAIRWAERQLFQHFCGITSEYVSAGISNLLNAVHQFFFTYHIYLPFTRKQIVSICFGRYVRTRFRVAIYNVSGPPVFHMKMGLPFSALPNDTTNELDGLFSHNLP